jgi:WD40 repeat protein/serine/threonine protein kinase
VAKFAAGIRTIKWRTLSASLAEGLHMNERSIFAAALDITDPAARAAYLDEVCGQQPRLRQHIDELLAAQEKLGSFLAGPPIMLPGTSAYLPVSEGPGTRIGPYKLLQQIGEGGMGIVYMAEQDEPVRRKVALKIIKPGMDSRQVIARFEAERQALAMMDHQNIAKVFDAGMTETGRPYFVMELVHGVPITTYCDDHKLTPRERLELLVPVCHAIQHAHQKGIIHRDVKPSNVLVTMYDDKPVPKVIDFGVAKAVEQRLTEKTMFTQFGALVGTFEYMSPEQAEMNAFGVDTRSDIYSLGVLLYELLTGTTPLERTRLRDAALDEMVRLIKEEEPPRPSVRLSTSESRAVVAAARRTEPARLLKLVRGELDWIVMRCLEKDRTRRYETASGLARDIERYLKDETVEACPPSVAYRLRKFVRKHRRPLGVAAVLFAVLVAGIALTVWQAIRARQAEQDALRQRNAALVQEQKAEHAEDEAQNERTKVVQVNQQLMQARNDLQQALYAAQMNLAQHAWNSAAGLAGARELLDQHRPGPRDEDLRGFEWHYLDRLCHTELRTFRGQGHLASSAQLSHDGRRLAVGTIVWDLQTGQELLSCKRTHPDLQALGFCQDDRGLVVQAGTKVGTLDAQSGKELWMHQADSEYIWCHAISADRRQLATGGNDATVKVWDLETGKVLLELRGHRSGITRVAFSPDGRRLASASFDKIVRLWDAEKGVELFTLEGHGSKVRHIDFSHDGSRLASGSDDGTVKVWDVRQGRQLLTFEGQRGRCWGVAFSPDDRLLLGNLPGRVTAWDARSGKERYVLSDLPQTITASSFSPDGKYVAGACGRTVVVWDAQTGREVVQHRGHADRVLETIFASDGRRIISTAADGTVKVWDVEKAPEAVRIRQYGAPVHALAVHQGRVAVAYAPSSGGKANLYKSEIRIEDARNSRGQVFSEGHDVWVTDLAFSSDGSQLASVAADQTVKIWDTQSGRQFVTLAEKDDRKAAIGLGLLAYAPDGRTIASVSSSRKILLWDVRTARQVLWLGGDAGWVEALAYSPEGARLAAAGGETVKVWDVQTGREALTIRWPAMQVQCIAYSPDGRYLAGGSERDTIRLWDAATGKVVRDLRGHTGAVEGLVFSPDGRRLASASSDHTVKIWSAATGDELLTLTGPHGFTRVAFSPDGHQLIAACGNEVRTWDATPRADSTGAR